VASGDTFPAEEYGSGRLTPLVDAPTWLKAEARREDEDRATLTPSDRAFLESPPTYEEGGSLLPSLQPPPTPVPSTLRRVMSLMLFVAIAGSASAVLVMAVMRLLGRSLPW
jgi:hypothetical protein